jgi:hypothetical protein
MSAAAKRTSLSWDQTMDTLFLERLINVATPLGHPSGLAGAEDRRLDLGEQALQRLASAIRRALVIHRYRVEGHAPNLLDVLEAVRDELRAHDRNGHQETFERADAPGLLQVVSREVAHSAPLGDDGFAEAFKAPLDRLAERAVSVLLRFIIHVDFPVRCGFGLSQPRLAESQKGGA